MDLNALVARLDAKVSPDALVDAVRAAPAVITATTVLRNPSADTQAKVAAGREFFAEAVRVLGRRSSLNASETNAISAALAYTDVHLLGRLLRHAATTRGAKFEVLVGKAAVMGRAPYAGVNGPNGANSGSSTTALVAAFRAALATLSTEVLFVDAAVVPQPHDDSGSDPASSESSDDDALPVAAVAAAAREEGTGSRRLFLSAEALRASALSAFDGNADTAEGVAAAMRAALRGVSDSSESDSETGNDVDNLGDADDEAEDGG